MFGGLEVKGSGDKKDEKEVDASSSGFAFMNSGTPAPAAEASASSSGFSFMSGSGSPAPEAPAPSSGFNFMSTGAKKEEVEPPPPPVDSPAAPAASAFGFMTTDATPPAMESPKATSGFNFVDKSNGASEPAPDLPPKPDLLATSNPPIPAGTGIVFGGASKKPIKRRTRAAKPGGRGGETMPPPQHLPVSMPAPAVSAPPVAVAPAPEPTPVATKEGAAEAARRAEQFMQTMQQQAQPVVPQYDSEPTSLSVPESGFAPPVDVELEAAKAAAEEAQARLAKSGKSGFHWFGGGRKWGSQSNVHPHMELDQPQQASPGGGASHVGGLNMGSSALANAVKGTSSPEKKDPTEESAAERIQREQEEINRAMAERQMAMQQQKAQEQRTLSPISFSPQLRQVSPPPPPPPPKTAKEQLEDLFKKFEINVKQAMDRVSNLRQQRNMLLDERFVALAKERLAIQQIAQTESQQMAAAEAEDFELAERLQVVLDGHQREKAEVSAILENISRALSQLDAQTPTVVGAVSACFQDMETELKDFETEQQSAEREDGSEAIRRFTVTAKQLSAEDERLKSEVKHMERDEELVTEERKELDAAISEQTADMEKSREAAMEKLQFVEGEIEFLRKQLREKETDAIRLRNEVDFHDTEIGRIKVKFTRQLDRVQKKEISLEDHQKEWKNEKTAYEKLREAHDAEVAAHSEALLAKTEVMERLKKEIALAGTFREIVSKEVVFDDSRNESTEADGDLAQLQADVVKCEASATEARALLKADEAILVNLDAEHKRLLARIPQLETEKKEAAARRDFKTAGRASKEIKEATARAAECEKDLKGAAFEKRNAAKAEVGRLEKELEAKRLVSNEKEKEVGKESMEKLADKIRSVIETKKTVCGNGAGTTVQSIGAVVLKGQINALVLEGQAYGDKFGGWEDFMKELDDGSVESEPEISTPLMSPSREQSTRASDEVDDKVVAQAKHLTQRLQAVEQFLEQAVAREDYDEAEEANAALLEIQTEFEKLALTDAETEIVMAEEEETPVADEGTHVSEDRPEDSGEEQEEPSDDEVTPAGDESEGVEREKETTDSDQGSVTEVEETPAGEGSDTEVEETPAGEGSDTEVEETPAGEGSEEIEHETAASTAGGTEEVEKDTALEEGAEEKDETTLPDQLTDTRKDEIPSETANESEDSIEETPVEGVAENGSSSAVETRDNEELGESNEDDAADEFYDPVEIEDGEAVNGVASGEKAAENQHAASDNGMANGDDRVVDATGSGDDDSDI